VGLDDREQQQPEQESLDSEVDQQRSTLAHGVSICQRPDGRRIRRVEWLGIVLLVLVVLVAAIVARDRRRRLSDDAPMSIRDHDWERRAYGEPSQGAPAPQSDANRFGGGTST